MTNPSQPAPPSPSSPPSPPSAPTPRPTVATLSRELADFLVELSITLNKHAIYPQSPPLLHGAVDGVANRLGTLFVGERESLSIGVARRQLIIEGVATDPLNAVLKELAQRLHEHHVGAANWETRWRRSPSIRFDRRNPSASTSSASVSCGRTSVSSRSPMIDCNSS